MRILVLSNTVPWPAWGGAQLRVLNLVERIARRHDVTLACHLWHESERVAIETLQARGIRVVGGLVRFPSWKWQLVAAARYALRGLPPEAAKYQARELEDLVRAGDYDILQLEETLLAPYLRFVPDGGRHRRVLTLHNVHFLQDVRIAQIEPSLRWQLSRRFNAAWMRSYEPRVAAAVDRAVCVTEDDRQLLQDAAPRACVDVLPNGVDTQTFVPLPTHEGPPVLLFVGTMVYRPCADAAIWLAREILPLVRRTHPDVELWIVGRRPEAEVRALAGDGVFVTGAVEDVRPYYAKATLAVAPLRAGGGSRLKILEAMALGRAVVATTLGAEGLEVTDGTHVVLADDATAIARAITRLLDDRARRRAMELAARELVEHSYDWDVIAERQLALYDELRKAPRAASLGPPPGAGEPTPPLPQA